MKKHKVLTITILLFALCQISFLGRFANAEAGAPAFSYQVNPRAIQQYTLRPASELSKILYLLDLFKGSKVFIVYDGVEYDYKTALKYSRKYIARNYKNEKAEKWILKNASKSAQTNKPIYVKSVEASLKPLSEILVEELKNLNKKKS